MKCALICTVYNEAGGLGPWIEALKRQTVFPDEFVIVDGGSTDNTVELLRRGFDGSDFPAPQIIVRRCNIAEGRNMAIRHSTQEIIASTDAGSIADPRWLEEITRPFQEHSDVDVVGGDCPVKTGNELQEQVNRIFSFEPDQRVEGGACTPSSRNVAFTRRAWTAVGGYPEWLTLTAEDALFNNNLIVAGFRFYYQPSAKVTWELRPDLRSYLKMLRSYGYGSAETGQAPHLYRNWLLTTLVPPLILFSRHPLGDAPLRYLRNAASALGWVEGLIKGHRPPAGWKWIDGNWASPETQATLAAKSSRPEQAVAMH